MAKAGCIECDVFARLRGVRRTNETSIREQPRYEWIGSSIYRNRPVSEDPGRSAGNGLAGASMRWRGVCGKAAQLAKLFGSLSTAPADEARVTGSMLYSPARERRRPIVSITKRYCGAFRLKLRQPVRPCILRSRESGNKPFTGTPAMSGNGDSVRIIPPPIPICKL